MATTRRRRRRQWRRYTTSSLLQYVILIHDYSRGLPLHSDSVESQRVVISLYNDERNNLPFRNNSTGKRQNNLSHHTTVVCVMHTIWYSNFILQAFKIYNNQITNVCRFEMNMLWKFYFYSPGKWKVVHILPFTSLHHDILTIAILSDTCRRRWRASAR